MTASILVEHPDVDSANVRARALELGLFAVRETSDEQTEAKSAADREREPESSLQLTREDVRAILIALLLASR